MGGQTSLLPSATRPAAASELTDREGECLLWAARGKTSWETAVILSVSESAVKKHLGSAAQKLGACTRTHAVALAITQGSILQHGL